MLDIFHPVLRANLLASHAPLIERLHNRYGFRGEQLTWLTVVRASNAFETEVTLGFETRDQLQILNGSPNSVPKRND